MSSRATVGAFGSLIFLTTTLSAQTLNNWQPIGNSLLNSGLAGFASGPVDRVWYSNDGSTLYIRTASSRVFQTSDLEKWQVSSAVPPPPSPPYLLSYPDLAMVGNLRDIAVAPGNSDEISVATDAGVFRSADGGRSWSGLNDDLKNLPITRILNVPNGTDGLRIALTNNQAAEWPPGNKLAWLPADNSDLQLEANLRKTISSQRNLTVTAVATEGTFIYAGFQNGEIDVSSDSGLTWTAYSMAGSGPIERFWIDAINPRLALAAAGASPSNTLFQNAPVHVLHTLDGGAFWDNLTANLPDIPAHGIAADPTSGAVYVATDVGVFVSYTNLSNSATLSLWTQVPGLPQGIVTDVKLDPAANQLFAALDGYGVYATLAPHRLRSPVIVNAANFQSGPAAPGSLLTIAGAQTDSVRSGDQTIPVLAATPNETHIQIPFEIQNSFVTLSANVLGGITFPSISVAPTAPAIFTKPDGSPMLIDSDNGVMLDAMTPAHSGSRIQILTTGLGRVTPEWPTGLAAPPDNPPRVTATVRAYLDGIPVEVTRAALAPGYIGIYLVEVTIPKVVNYGPGELYIDAGGASSNRVRVYIAP